MNNGRMGFVADFTLEGLKLHILLDFRKGNPFKFEAATKIALNVVRAF